MRIVADVPIFSGHGMENISQSEIVKEKDQILPIRTFLAIDCYEILHIKFFITEISQMLLNNRYS